MAYEFNLSRDDQGAISYGLRYQSAQKYSNAFAAADETYITLALDANGNLLDRYAIFFPSVGAYQVSSDPNPTITSNTPMIELNTLISPAHLDLEGWPFSATEPTEKRLYIKSFVAQNMSIIIMRKGRI